MAPQLGNRSEDAAIGWCCLRTFVARAHEQDTIIRLLYSLGSRHEVERYLRIFTSSSKASSGGVLPEAKFAVLK
jgi:hypothetical protein